MRVKYFLFALALLFTGCAQERPVKKVLSNSLRHSKTTFQGEFLYLKSISHVESPGNIHYWIPTGLHLSSEALVRFEIRDTELLVVSTRMEIQEKRPATKAQIIARFPIRNVDVLRKQNADGQDTHEEEQTEERRDPKEREHILFETTRGEWDTLDTFALDTKNLTPPETITVDPSDGSINFEVSRRLNDDTMIRQRYSFAKHDNSQPYEPRAYTLNLEGRFGFFKTTPPAFDRYGRVTSSQQNDHQVMNRRHPGRTAVYYFAPNFPEHLKPLAHSAVQKWNKELEAAIGHPLLELRENSGQTLGDVRYNLLVYDNTPFNVHGILGYGPTVTHPDNGEILKGDVMFYGGTIRRAVFNDRLWQGYLGDLADFPAPPIRTFEASDRPVPHRLARRSKVSPIAAQERYVPWSPAKLLGFTRAYEPEKASELLREELLNPMAHHTTRLTDTLGNSIQELYKELEQDDDAVESLIFAPLALHEMGHNLGLRHNFKASADIRDNKSTSVMDYGFLASRDPNEPGPYDSAALKVAYGNAEQTKEALQQNFLYCTDHQVYTALDPMCGHYDRGDSLFELVRTHEQRYFASYIFNNLRLDRAHFDRESPKEYVLRVLSHLLPLRLIHDHSDAILKADATKDNASLWYLLRSRIEADKSTKKENLVTVTVKAGENLELKRLRLEHGYRLEERNIDLEKVKAAVSDAQLARIQSVLTLIDVVWGTERREEPVTKTPRPDYDETDEVKGQVHVRGVLPDKLIALLLLGVPTPDPLSRRQNISPFSTLGEQGMRDFFISVISDFSPLDPTEGVTQRDLDSLDLDLNIRELATLIIRHQLGVPGASPSALELVRLEKFPIMSKGELHDRRRHKDELLFRNELAELLKNNPEKVTAENLRQAMHLQFPTPNYVLETLLKGIAGNQNELDSKVVSASNLQITAELQAKLSKIESEAPPEIAALFPQDDVREPIRHAYRNYFRVKSGMVGQTMTVEEARSKVLLAEMQRANLNETFLPVHGSYFLRASLRSSGSGRETATGYLLRDNLARREDRWLAALGLLKLAQEAYKSAPSAENASTVEKAEAEMNVLEQRYLTERAFAEKLFRLFEYPVEDQSGDVLDMMTSLDR